mgnify:CR=1 FL=1
MEELGLRFTTEVSADYYESLKDKSVRLGMLVVAKWQYNDILGGNLTHDSISGSSANVEDVWYANNLEVLYFNENTGNYEYYASILYNLEAIRTEIDNVLNAYPDAFGGITDVELLVKYMYATQLVAVPYVIVDGEPTYGAVSNPASAVHLANAALLQGVENAQIFAEKYLGTITEINDLLVEQDGTLLGIDADEYAYLEDATFTDGDSYIAYDYNEFISGTKTTKTAGNKFALTSAITDGKVAGQNYSFGAYLPGYNYIRFNYQFVTDAFEVAEDFNIFLNQNKNTLDGYYVLANDIDMTGYTIDNYTSGTKYNASAADFNIIGGTTFAGTFDGCGFAIKNLKGQLFNHLKAGAKVQNLALIGSTRVSGQGLLAYVPYEGVTINNLIVTTADKAGLSNTGGIFRQINLASVTLNNVIVRTTSNRNSTDHGYIAGWAATGMTATSNNCYYIAANTASSAGYLGIGTRSGFINTVEDAKAAMLGTYKEYTTYASFANDGTKTLTDELTAMLNKYVA